MPVVEGDIDILSRSILSEARQEADDLRAQAQAEADAIRQRAQVVADRERATIIEQAGQEAGRLHRQALATAQLRARAMELEHRERLLDAVFAAVGGQLPSVLKRRDYPQIAEQLLREALAQLRTERAEIQADPQTQKALTQGRLDDISSEMHVQLSIGKPLENGLGVVVNAGDGHLQFDNTLGTRLARSQGALRLTVYHVLMGEKV